MHHNFTRYSPHWNAPPLRPPPRHSPVPGPFLQTGQTPIPPCLSRSSVRAACWRVLLENLNTGYTGLLYMRISGLSNHHSSELPVFFGQPDNLVFVHISYTFRQFHPHATGVFRISQQSAPQTPPAPAGADVETIQYGG